VTVVVGYRGEAIERALGQGAALGVSIVYRRQDQPEGTARALLCAREDVGGAPFLLTWGDVLVEGGFYREIVAAYRASPCDVLLAVNEVDDPWRGAAVEVEPAGRVLSIVEKPPRGSSRTRWNHAGVLVLDPLVLDYAERAPLSPRGEHELPWAIAAMIEDGREVRAIPVRGVWRDLASPRDLAAAERALAAIEGARR
jgi:dTDP-glucose pyrophosphorylase